MSNPSSVCVFCGSRRGFDPAMAATAETLGKELAAAGIRLIYGGGGVGLMGILARAALEAGGAVTGVIPKHLARRELMLEDLDDMRVVGSMHDRKRVMFELSDAMVALPGGMGTLDETIEVITWKQIGIHDCPIVLVDIDGYWQPFEALMDHYQRTGFGYSHDRQLYQLVPDAKSVLPALREAREPGVPPSPELT